MQLTLEEIFEAKREARRELCALPFVEKIRRVEELRDGLEALRVNRNDRSETDALTSSNKAFRVPHNRD